MSAVYGFIAVCQLLKFLFLLNCIFSEHERKKKEKVLKWDALKRACNIYKLNLNMHIDLKEEQDSQHVKISFFKYNKLSREYFTQLLFSNGEWSGMYYKSKYKSRMRNIIDNIDSYLCNFYSS